MSNYAPAKSPGQEMDVLPDVQQSSGGPVEYEAAIDDKKQPLDGLTSNDRLASSEAARSDGEADLDTKAAEVAQFNQKLPKIDYSHGAGPFFKSVGHRLHTVFTPRLLLCILIGQVLALCITTTSTVTTELSIGAWSLPATQTFFVYFILMSVYTPLTIYKYGLSAWAKMIKVDGWKYIILACFDVFGNYSTVYGFKYTNLLSCLLINAWATPVSMVICFFLLKSRYHWTQLLGASICIAGLVVLVVTDVKTGKDWGYANKVKGDLFMLLGATLYGCSNGFEEYLVRGRPLYEVVGQLGLWGFIINGILAGASEHAQVHEAVWSGRNVGLLFGYMSAMLILYTMAPILFRFASSPFYNLSLMAADFYGLLIGLKLFGYSPYWTYFVAFVVVIIGLITYNLVAPLESHAKTDVVARGRQQLREDAAGEARVIGAPKGKLGSIF